MFFRRHKEQPLSFADRLEKLKQAGYTVSSQEDGTTRLARKGCIAVVADGPIRLVDHGLSVGGEIGKLVDVGYQKIFQTPSGRRAPALARQLQALHTFLEDLRDGLGLTSLYNESLGTVNASHRYDRVEDRDRGVPRRPWQR